MRYLTVFSDASHDHRTGATGYAFFVRDEVQIIKKVVGLEWPLKKSTDAELFAACHGILHAVNHLPHSPGDCIVAQTDCLEVIRMFESHEHPSVLSVIGFVESFGLSLRFKHVKAHTENIDSRSYVNRWCDISARREQRKRRASIGKDQIQGA